jgi:hypothetical protein
MLKYFDKIFKIIKITQEMALLDGSCLWSGVFNICEQKVLVRVKKVTVTIISRVYKYKQHTGMLHYRIA